MSTSGVYEATRVVRWASKRHLPSDQLEILKVAERSERELLTMWAREARR